MFALQVLQRRSPQLAVSNERGEPSYAAAVAAGVAETIEAILVEAQLHLLDWRDASASSPSASMIGRVSSAGVDCAARHCESRSEFENCQMSSLNFKSAFLKTASLREPRR